MVYVASAYLWLFLHSALHELLWVAMTRERSFRPFDFTPSGLDGYCARQYLGIPPGTY